MHNSMYLYNVVCVCALFVLVWMCVQCAPMLGLRAWQSMYTWTRTCRGRVFSCPCLFPLLPFFCLPSLLPHPLPVSSSPLPPFLSPTFYFYISPSLPLHTPFSYLVSPLTPQLGIKSLHMYTLYRYNMGTWEIQVLGLSTSAIDH